MNRHKRRRKPRIKGRPIRASKVKYQKNYPGWMSMPWYDRNSFATTQPQACPYVQYYGTSRHGKSVVMQHYLQQIGRGVRVITHRPEIIDYAEIDRRALLHLDPVTLDNMSCMKDYHLARAAEKFGIDAKDVTPEQRRIAKAENFFDLYSGERPPAIANQKEPGDAE